MDTQNLEQEVEIALTRVFESPRIKKSRCHEIARLLRSELQRKGYGNVAVSDGVVSYDVDFLLERHEKNFGLNEESDFEDEPVVRTACNKWTKRIAHSWCELGEVVVDFHHLIKATPYHILESLLIVDTKENLSGKANYQPNGKEFSVFGNTFIYVPFMFTRLRI